MAFEDASRVPRASGVAPEPSLLLAAAGAQPGSLATALEDAKWDSLLESLPNAFYSQALHIGAFICTEAMRLADRCQRLLTFQLSVGFQDLDRNALKAAVCGVASGAGVSSRSTDLLIISDLLPADQPEVLERLTALAARALPSGGHCALLHWTDDSPCGTSGEAGAEAFVRLAQSRLLPLRRRRTPDFRLDILERV